MKRTTRPLATGLLALVWLGSCRGSDAPPGDSEPPEALSGTDTSRDSRVVLHLGVVARSDPRLTTSGSKPLADYLTRRTPYRVELRVGRSTEDVELDPGVQDLVTYLEERLVEIAPLGALSFCLADERFGAVPLVRSLNDDGEPLERGVFIVKEDAPIRALGDLRGRSLALGPSHSTTSHLLALHELEEAGLGMDALAAVENLESDGAVIEAVRSGAHEAGAVSELALSEGIEEIRALHAFDRVPSRALVVREDLPAGVRQSLRKALLDLEKRPSADRSGWDPLFRNGFAPASETDYARVRRIANQQSARCAGGCHPPVQLREAR